MTQPEFGFVVRSRNEERHIGHAIQSILDTFGKKTPIVVVDNDSTDDTLKVVQSFPRKFYNIDVINIPDTVYTPGRALNAGLMYMTQRDVKFTGILSSHCKIIQTDPKSISATLDENGCFGVLGCQIPIYRGKRVTPRYVWTNFLSEERIINPLEINNSEGRYFFHNAFSFIRTDVWQELPFDENLSGKEDRYWAGALVEQGMHFVFDPNLRCHHFWTPNGATWSCIG
tara:strand:- start:1043 stop:1726 length:684 start_codon:yes stop_codon:yes gene_type:complete